MFSLPLPLRCLCHILASAVATSSLHSTCFLPPSHPCLLVSFLPLHLLYPLHLAAPHSFPAPLVSPLILSFALFLLITSPVTNRSEAEGTVVSPCDRKWSAPIGGAGPPSSAPEAVWREGCLFEAICYLVIQLVAFISSVILPRDDHNVAAITVEKRTGLSTGWEGWDGVQQEDGTQGRRRNDEMGRMTKVQEGEGSERLQGRRDIN